MHKGLWLGFPRSASLKESRTIRLQGHHSPSANPPQSFFLITISLSFPKITDSKLCLEKSVNIQGSGQARLVDQTTQEVFSIVLTPSKGKQAKEKPSKCLNNGMLRLESVKWELEVFCQKLFLIMSNGSKDRWQSR